MQVKFGNTTKRKNSTLVPSVTGDLGDCLLKSPVSIVTPTFEIYSETYPDYNYCYVPEFHRYYFITDIVSTSAGQWDISCLVDVLATYKTGVLNTTAFVERAQSASNPRIPDGNTPMLMTFEKFAGDTVTIPFLISAEDAMSQTAGAIIVTISGKAGIVIVTDVGFSTPYIFTPDQLLQFRDMLFDDVLMQELAEYYVNPITFINSCIWIPCNPGTVQAGSGPIKVGNKELGVTAGIAKRTTSFTTMIEIPLKYFTEDENHVRSYADYRNVEPYTTFEMFLPGVGTVEIPISMLIHDGSSLPQININAVLSIPTGSITYTIRDLVGGGEIVGIYKGTIGVALPVVAQTSQDPFASERGFSQILSGAGTAVGGLFSAANSGLSGYSIGAITGGLAQINSGLVNIESGNRKIASVAGSLGGFDGAQQNCEGIRWVVRTWPISGSAFAIGRPYCNTSRLSNFTGYVKCAGAYIGVNATDVEHNMLISMVNGGFYIE